MVKLRVLPAAIIFIGSYLPLALILLAQNFEFQYLSHPFCFGTSKVGNPCVIPLKNPEFSIGLFLLCLFCFIITLVALAWVRPKRVIIVRSVDHVPAELMNYVLPYVVSFMSIDYQETGKFVGFTIFLAWMFWITFKSGQIMMNPVLIAFGWRLYDISYIFDGGSQEYSSRVLSRTTLIPSNSYKHTGIDDIMIIKSA